MVADAPTANRRGLVIGVMLALATVFFVWGSFAQRSGHDDVHALVPSGESAENGESAAQRAAERGAAEGRIAEVLTSESAEYRPLGINLESTPLVIGGAVVSVLPSTHGRAPP